MIANGDVTATNGAGIYTAHFGGGPTNVTVSSGVTVVGGTAGVTFFAGTGNALKNFGTVENIAGVTGTAIRGFDGDETVNNFGVVTGDVVLGTGANAFNNMEGGLFNSGNTVIIGDGNLLTNHGTLSPGGANTILTTTLTGDFSQPGSELAVDLLGFNADLLAVTGDTELAGKVKPLFTLSGLGAATQWTVLTSVADRR
jgi:hypothetical protein